MDKLFSACNKMHGMERRQGIPWDKYHKGDRNRGHLWHDDPFSHMPWRCNGCFTVGADVKGSEAENQQNCFAHQSEVSIIAC